MGRLNIEGTAYIIYAVHDGDDYMGSMTIRADLPERVVMQMATVVAMTARPKPESFPPIGSGGV
jgi:hypothetical protein